MSPREHRAEVVHRAARRALDRFPNLPVQVREDLAQEASLRTLLAERVVHPARFAAQVAAHLAIDCLRRKTEVLLPDAGELTATCPWEARVEAHLDWERVRRIIGAGPSGHRETLRVLFVEDTSLAEVVERTVRANPGADPHVERDRWYKRRKRALTWFRAAVAEAA